MSDTMFAELETALARADATSFRTAGESCIEAGLASERVLQLAVNARDTAMAMQSVHLLERIAATSPPYARAALTELAFRRRLAGDFPGAVGLLQQAAACSGAAFRTELFLAHMLHANADHDEADEILHGLSGSSPAEQDEVSALIQFGAYLKAFPLQRALDMLDTLKQRFGWLNHAGYAGLITEAQAAGRAFSLLRLGDGEGACLTLGAEDERAFEALLAANRENRISVWFGADYPWATNGFLQTSHTLDAGMSEADVLAIPDVAWIKHSYQISSQCGVPSLVNILRSLLRRESSEVGFKLCTHAAHVELHQKGHLERIIRAAKSVSVITCLPELPTALKTRFDLDDVTLYQIPGEQKSSDALGEGVVYGNHYPQVYEDMTARLSQPHDGRLFLIAGGLLGKLYAATIRRNGGVALDVGSLVDSWMGKITRPGKSEHLRLDADQQPHVSDAYLAERFMHIKGMSSWTAAAVCCRLMRDQSNQGLRGNLLEIGVYEGRFFIGLALCTVPSEMCVAIDTFEWPDEGVQDRFLMNCTQAGVDLSRVVVEKSPSGDVSPGLLRKLAKGPARLIHIDGALGYDAVSHDLRLAKPLLHVNGVICLENMLHPQFPELVIALGDFLKSSPNFHLFAVIERDSPFGSCKFLLARTGAVQTLQSSLLKHFPDQVLPQRAKLFQDSALIIRPFAR